MTAEEFLRAYAGESNHVEFKQGVSEARIARAVAAFSNTDGGVVLVGVGPDGRAVGVNVDGEALARLHRVVASVHDGGRYEVGVVSVGDVDIAVLSVARREQGFAQTAEGLVVVRREAMNVTLMGAQLAEFVTGHALARFEATATGLTVEQADPALVDDVASRFGWSTDIGDRMVEHGLATGTGARGALTVAGVLYLVAEPERVLGKSYIEVFRYRDDATMVEDKRYRITGPLPVQVAGATSRVTDEIGSELAVVGLRRYEMERIPLAVLREAVANAVAHRVYEDNRRPVTIEIRPSRVLVRSPGPLPEPVTVANLREQNAARNLAVIDALRRYRLAEDAGRGIDLMQDVMAEQLLDAPVFDADSTSVSVSLPMNSAVAPFERAWIGEIENRGALKPRDRILLVHAARGEVLTNTVARELLGADSTHARGALQRLRDAGFLSQSGERAGARYVLAPSIAPPPGLRLSSATLRQDVLTLARSEPLTNRLLRERFALDRVEALKLLNDLVDAGDLVRVGERRGARYLPSDDR
ncbi:ATP-binding protein [Actinomycetospora sp. OC33-EN08]|uniref:ATP-binding protein n=1 Tax=Actinomycetospora aurantiaca TaxID=3129233 RepID=A0ABU8MNE0_9PSEU